MNRHRLANRHQSENFNFECNNLHYTATVSRIDGEVVELFLNNHLVNSDADVNARDAAVIFSIARQYGVPIDVMRDALMRDMNGRASGPLGRAIDIVSSLVENRAK